MTQRLLDQLQNPALYDHPVEQFEVLETHISWVLLTGPYAYKIRKSVDFGFLDFTSLKKRLDDCQEELRLNQRLSPQLYCGLTTIYGTASKPSLQPQGKDQSVIEYAVKMRQFRQSSLLSALDRDGKLLPEHIDNLAKMLAEFHTAIPAATNDSYFGSPETLWSVISQNFEQIHPHLQDSDDLAQLERLQHWSQAQFDALKPQIEQRKRNGHVREGHGDLHLGNIAIYDDEICPFDCIEFNPKYRWVDTFNDTAFLLMDLESRDHTAFARRLLDRYLEHSGDYQALPLLKLFKSYRAMVRAKVTLLSDPDLSPASLETYRRYTDLAEHYTQQHSPKLILMHGISGSGKSWLSDQLLQQQQFIRLRSDIFRQHNSPQHGSEDIRYSAESVFEIYRQLLTVSHQLLQAGYSVVVDATFLKSAQRTPFLALAGKLDIPVHILACIGNPQQFQDRIQSRREIGDPSEASVDVMKQQLGYLEPFTEDEAARVINVETSEVDLVSLTDMLSR